jgi:hypothetical protein
MNGSPLLGGRAAASPLFTAGGALSPKDDNGAPPLSTGASAGSCELRRLTESLLSTRPGDRLLVNLLRFRVYGLLILVFIRQPINKGIYLPAFYIGLGAVGARIVDRQIASHLQIVSPPTPT